MGMPLMVVNNEVVPQSITNDPGQIIRVNGTGEDVASAVRYVAPPSFSPGYDNSVNSLISNTMTHAGANDAALGDMRPDNTSAIIALREAAAVPMQPYQNAFYAFIEDVARIWAEFWLNLYGRRSLKIAGGEQTWYFPFDGERYRNLVLSVRVDVGASTLWSESQSIKTLDNLLAAGIITPEQYLKRLPGGIVPDLNGLIKDMAAQRDAEQTEAQRDAEQTEAQQGAEQTEAQRDAEQTEAQRDAEQTEAQQAAEQTEAQQAAEQTGAQRGAGQTGAQRAAEQTEAQQAAGQTGAQRNAEQTAAQRGAEQTAAQQGAGQTGAQRNAEQAGAQAGNLADIVSQLPPELQEQFAALPPEEQAALLKKAGIGV